MNPKQNYHQASRKCPQRCCKVVPFSSKLWHRFDPSRQSLTVWPMFVIRTTIIQEELIVCEQQRRHQLETTCVCFSHLCRKTTIHLPVWLMTTGLLETGIRRARRWPFDRYVILPFSRGHPDLTPAETVRDPEFKESVPIVNELVIISKLFICISRFWVNVSSSNNQS